MAGILSRLLRGGNLPVPLASASISIGDVTLAVHFRRHAQARRLVVRLNSDASAVSVTVPHRVSRQQALDFVERSRGWIEKRLAAHGGSIALAPGNRLALRGIEHEIRHVASHRGTIVCDPQHLVIHVSGDLPHVPRRLLDWLKRSAREELTAATQKYARAMGVSYRRVTIRDQRSRWGSCSSTGELSYSWRLILTPPHVLDYVAAHEVAHLKHMNHGPRFWRLVLTHCPEAQAAKRWLKAHGQSVHRVVTP